MLNPTTQELSRAAAKHLMPLLFKTEDFDSFEAATTDTLRKIGLDAMTECIEAFDRELARHPIPGWSVHEKVSRTIVTLLGAMTYKRTVYLDEFGRRRTLCDELLGIPQRSRLSSGAFLWICQCASELSYRKTARAFADLTGTYIAHVTVMNCVHLEGSLLKASSTPPFYGMSQDRLFVEADGLWVHLQEGAHRKHALPRFLYEQAKKTRSFELKMACAYAGKKKVAPGRYERGGLLLTCGKDESDVFWERVVEMIAKAYEISDIEEVVIHAKMLDNEFENKIGKLKPKDKEPRSRSVLDSWIAKAEGEIDPSRSGRLAWLISTTVCAAKLQGVLDSQGKSRFDLILSIKGQTWKRVQIEISPPEGHAVDSFEAFPAPRLDAFGIPTPDHLVGLALSYQIAQKVPCVTLPVGTIE